VHLDTMPEHKWAPPEHPDVTLDEPYGLGPEHIEGPGERLATPRPVCVWIRYQHAELLRLKGFATAGVVLAGGGQESDAEGEIFKAGSLRPAFRSASIAPLS